MKRLFKIFGESAALDRLKAVKYEMPVQELARYCLDSSVQLVNKSQPKSLVDVLRECYD